MKRDYSKILNSHLSQFFAKSELISFYLSATEVDCLLVVAFLIYWGRGEGNENIYNASNMCVA